VERRARLAEVAVIDELMTVASTLLMPIDPDRQQMRILT
jgi:hypothetical protein